MSTSDIVIGGNDRYVVWRRTEGRRDWLRASGPQGNSVEVSITDEDVRVRDSKDPIGTELRFSHAEWQRHIEACRDGVHDLPRDPFVGRPGISNSGA